MPKYIPYNYNQHSMVVINFEEQIKTGTVEHAIHFLIEHKLDLFIFYPNYKNDDGGRPAYDPAILLKIILFAYSKGITSSREIEWCCQTNIIFKALSCDTVPHFTTIAHFISSHADEIDNVFEQILLICDEQGLLGHELFAIDDCKMPSNAAKEWSGTIKELEQKRAKIRRQIHHHITDNESAKMTTSKGTIQGYNGLAAVDKKHQIIVDAQAFGGGQEHHTLQPIIESVDQRYKRLGIHDNIYGTDAIITADTGFAKD